MLRITEVSQAKKGVILKIEGELSGEDVALLKQEGTRHLHEAGCLTLDLTGVQSIDEAGIALLRRWSKERVTLRSESPFIRVLLKAHGIVAQRFQPCKGGKPCR